ncbi:MAG: type IV pilin protein [Actinomycetota bacterium]
MVKLQAKKQENQKGFSLIELLVVILVIAVLAAIAIPAFLSQRKKGWVAAQQSDLKNAATAAETYGTGNGGRYTGLDEADLATNGFGGSSGVIVTVEAASSVAYCLKAVHTPATTNWFYYSNIGEPRTGAGSDCSTLP